MVPVRDPEHWARKRVLITGAAGFLGRYVTDALLARKCIISATSRFDRSSREQRDIQWFRIDLSESASVERLISRIQPQIVFHLSSFVNAERDVSLVKPTFKAEVLATQNLLLALHGKRVDRVVLPGSLEEPEGDCAPSSPYAAAKVTTRNYARMFELLYDMPIAHARVFMCYGPGQPDSKVIPYLIQSFQSGKRPTIASTDRAIDWIFVADAAQGLLAVASSPLLPGRSIDIGSGRLTTIGEIAEKVRSLTNPSIEIRYPRRRLRAHEQIRCADADTTFRLTGWRAQTSLNEGLEATIKAVGEVDSRIGKEMRMNSRSRTMKSSLSAKQLRSRPTP